MKKRMDKEQRLFHECHRKLFRVTSWLCAFMFKNPECDKRINMLFHKTLTVRNICWRLYLEKENNVTWKKLKKWRRVRRTKLTR